LAAVVRHRLARAGERAGQFLRSFHALDVAAVRAHDRIIRWRGVEIGEEAAVGSPAAPSLNMESVARRTAP
jgi:hypothetical protein